MWTNSFAYRLKFDSVDECSKWCHRLKQKCVTPERLENLFAFAFFAWREDNVPESPSSDTSDLSYFQQRGKVLYMFRTRILFRIAVSYLTSQLVVYLLYLSSYILRYVAL